LKRGPMEIRGPAAWHLVSLAILATCCALAPVTARSESCSTDSRLERFEGIELCIPPGNDRYQFERGHLTGLFWLGDDPIPRPPGDDPTPDGSDLDMTVAVAPFGSDRDVEALSSAVSASILDAAKANGTDRFEADVRIQGQVFRFQFERLDTSLLRGTHQKDKYSTFVIFLRRPAANGPSHLILCTDYGTKSSPAHSCLAFAQVAGRTIPIMIAGKNVERSFRLSEQIAAELNAFAAWTSAP
jgi:hypothetical protein